MAETLHDLAHVYTEQGKFTEAEPLYREISEVWREPRGSQDPALEEALRNLADIHDEQERHEETDGLRNDGIRWLNERSAPPINSAKPSSHSNKNRRLQKGFD